MDRTLAQLVLSPDESTVKLSGCWTIAGIGDRVTELVTIIESHPNIIQVSAQGIDELDSTGAWLLNELQAVLNRQDQSIQLLGLDEDQQLLLNMVSKKATDAISRPSDVKEHNWVYRLGERCVNKVVNTRNFLHFIGQLVVTILRTLMSSERVEWASVLANIRWAGSSALPIIALMSFLIGVVVTYQMGIQLEKYDMNIFIVNLSGLAIFREFGPLITAIISAGRTATSFAAQIGTMMLNEEVDALATMGLSPLARLVLPKLLGLVIAIPLLTVWADIFGVLGSMVMAKSMLSIQYTDFLSRFSQEISLTQFLVGMVKAPVFALTIACVGCYQGFQVSRGADSVGRVTTLSAVQALFLIIIIDAVFSILFSMQGI